MKNFERVTERDWNEAKFSFKTEEVESNESCF